jgi:ABC-2 type transport system ATP-binding protein
VNNVPVISAYDVGKRFVTHHRRPTSLKEKLVRRDGADAKAEFWALRDFSVEIGPGETVGLIGHNGSGKSTTLKLLAGILQPTSGTVHTLGRVASLLELGVGFSHELSGTDNVYLNASLLGLTRSETDELFPRIVEFSELGDRIRDPVKHYSSGMYVKLGFAVAVHVDPDILLVDEVLAVGDEAFQAKCVAKIKEFQQAGKTILVVSHALDQVVGLCNRAVLLDHGRVQYDGDPAHAVALMRRLLGTAVEPEPEEEPEEEPEPDSVVVALPEPFAVGSIEVSDHPGGEARYAVYPGDALSFRVLVDVATEVAEGAGGEVAAVLMAEGHVPVCVLRGAGATVPRVTGQWWVDFSLPAVPPLLGVFDLAVSVTDAATGRVGAARTFEQVIFVPGDRALGIVDCRYDVTVGRAVVPEPVVPAPAPRSTSPAHALRAP